MSLVEQIWSAIGDRMTALMADIDEYGRFIRDPSGDLTPGTELALHTGTIKRVKGETGSVRRRLSFRIEGSASGDEETGVAERLGRLHAGAIDILITEPTLGDLAETLEDTSGSFSTVERSEVRILTFDQAFELEFAAPHGRLSTTP